MSEENRPMVTITADEYFDLRSRAEANAYITQSVEGFRNDLNSHGKEIWDLNNRLNELEGNHE